MFVKVGDLQPITAVIEPNEEIDKMKVKKALKRAVRQVKEKQVPAPVKNGRTDAS